MVIGLVVLVGTSAQAQDWPVKDSLVSAKKILERVEVLSYTGRVVFRWDGTNGKFREADTRICGNPVAAYHYCLSPIDVNGRQIIFDKELHQGRIFVRDAPGTLLGRVGAVSIDPNRRDLSMFHDRLLPMLRMAQQTVMLLELPANKGRTDVFRRVGVKINGRPCTLLEITQRTPRGATYTPVLRG
jgi:hypothetical protein